MKNESADPPHRKASKTFRVLVSIVAVVGVLIAAYWLFRHVQKNRLSARLDAIRDAGYPVTLKELNDWYPQPVPGENAAMVYQAAFSKFSDKDSDKDLPIVGKGERPEPGVPLSDDMAERIAEYLERNTEALNLLHEAATMTGCRFAVDFTVGFNVSLNHLSRLRQAARLLSMETLIAIQKKDTDHIMASMAAQLKAARFARNEPIVISYLVHIALRSLATRNLQHALSGVTFSDNELRQLASMLSGFEDAGALIRALVGERCFGLDAMSNSGSPKGMGLPPALILVGHATGILGMNQTAYLDTMNDLIAIAEQPMETRLDSARLKMNEVDGMGKQYFLIQLLVPALGRLFEVDLRAVAGVRNATTALAIERYRLANEILPESLDDLVPHYLSEVPTDPFDGMPLRYKLSLIHI